MKQTATELGKSTLASVVATFVDMLIYLTVLHFTSHIAISAAVGAVTGGIIHYLLCKSVIFNATSCHVSTTYSLILYFATSWVGAGIHALATTIFSSYLGEIVGFWASKLIIFLSFSFPVSKFIVFGTIGAKIERFLTGTVPSPMRELRELPAIQ
ncbi:hypothetical protein RCL1_002139 [Eukaryota sp. TZLM3-RCL]